MANAPEMIPASEPSAEEKEDIQVNETAAGLFSKVRHVDMSLTNQEKADQTAEWIKEGNATIVEATFIFGRLSRRVDYLKVNTDGSLEKNEVKGNGRISEIGRTLYVSEYYGILYDGHSL